MSRESDCPSVLVDPDRAVLDDDVTTHRPALPLDVPDVYFGVGYGKAGEAAGNGEWLSVERYDGAWRMPVHLRTGDGWTDAVSPYGYSGVFASPELSETDNARAWQEAMEELREHQVLSLFLRQSPLFPVPFTTPPGEVLIDDHHTVLVDVREVDSAWAALEGRCRTSVRKARATGLTVRIEPAQRNDVEAGSDFRRLYEATMVRNQASHNYFFSDAYYEHLLIAPQGGLHLASVTDASGGIVGAALLMCHAGLVHYHLSGSDPLAARAGATNLLLWEAIEWACGRGAYSLHLGGGLENGDPLFKFKRSFGGALLSYKTFGVVVDPVGYKTATQSRADQLGVSVETLQSSRYFPTFRASA